MKTKVLNFVALILFVSLVMLSCSKENDPKPAPFNVVACTPTDKLDGVSVDAQIVVTFNKKPSAEMIAGKYFSLDEPWSGNNNWSSIECEAKFDGLYTIIYTPKTLLKKGISYGILLYGFAEDGTKLQRELRSSFTTAR
jgi:hypothetical protein